MKNQLLTTIAIAAGLTGLVAAEEDSERLAPPSAPEVCLVISNGNHCVVTFTFPHFAVANSMRDFTPPTLTGVDAKGNAVTFQPEPPYVSPELDVVLSFTCPTAGIQGGELDTHGTMFLTTGDDISFSAPATLRPEPKQSIEIDGTTFDVSIGNSNAHCFLIASLTPRNGELPCAMRCYWQDEEDTGEATPDLTVFDVAAQEGDSGAIRVRYPIYSDGKRVLVQTINVTNPRAVSFPLDYHIVTEPMMQTQFHFPQGSGIRVGWQGCATAMKDGRVGTIQQIDLFLDDKEEFFLYGSEATVEGEENYGVSCAPSSAPGTAGKAPIDRLTISIFHTHPADAGQVSYSGTLTVKTNKRTLTIPFTTSGNIRPPFRATQR